MPVQCIEYNLHYGGNLLGFPGEVIDNCNESYDGAPDGESDMSLTNIFGSGTSDTGCSGWSQCNIVGIIGEGVAASPSPVHGWVGSLSSINSKNGYWVKIAEDSCTPQICIMTADTGDDEDCGDGWFQYSISDCDGEPCDNIEDYCIENQCGVGTDYWNSNCVSYDFMDGSLTGSDALGSYFEWWTTVDGVCNTTDIIQTLSFLNWLYEDGGTSCDELFEEFDYLYPEGWGSVVEQWATAVTTDCPSYGCTDDSGSNNPYSAFGFDDAACNYGTYDYDDGSCYYTGTVNAWIQCTTTGLGNSGKGPVDCDNCCVGYVDQDSYTYPKDQVCPSDPGECSNGSYTDEETCLEYGETWIPSICLEWGTVYAGDPVQGQDAVGNCGRPTNDELIIRDCTGGWSLLLDWEAYLTSGYSVSECTAPYNEKYGCGKVSQVSGEVIDFQCAAGRCVDDCGVCRPDGDTNPEWNSTCGDCAGVIEGEHVYDGYSLSEITTLEETSGAAGQGCCLPDNRVYYFLDADGDLYGDGADGYYLCPNNPNLQAHCYSISDTAGCGTYDISTCDGNNGGDCIWGMPYVLNNLDLCPGGGTVDGCGCCSSTLSIIDGFPDAGTDCTVNFCVGCMDAAACNYNAEATIGSACTWPSDECHNCSDECICTTGTDTGCTCPGQQHDGDCECGLIHDDCGVCRIPGDVDWNTSGCVGCDGIINSGATVDDCGTCSGGTTGHEYNSDMGCNGVCIAFGGLEWDCRGSGVAEACGGSWSNENICYDCTEDGSCTDSDGDGICDCADACLDGSGIIDECGVCDGDGVSEACHCTDTSGLNDEGCCDDVVTDCNGVCGGDAEVDDCGGCNGGKFECDDGLYDYGDDSDCTTGTYCDCDSNEVDDCGVCGGPNWICDDPVACNYHSGCSSCSYADNNYDCAGNCCLDSGNDCGTGSGCCDGLVDTDCNGECGGTAVIDECEECGGDNYACYIETNNCTCAGCTYESAENYDAAALIEDGSCIFPPTVTPDLINITGDLIIPVSVDTYETHWFAFYYPYDDISISVVDIYNYIWLYNPDEYCDNQDWDECDIHMNVPTLEAVRYDSIESYTSNGMVKQATLFPGYWDISSSDAEDPNIGNTTDDQCFPTTAGSCITKGYVGRIGLNVDRKLDGSSCTMGNCTGDCGSGLVYGRDGEGFDCTTTGGCGVREEMLTCFGVVGWLKFGNNPGIGLFDFTLAGCTDAYACNFNPYAYVDDASCSYEIDCAGVCGGDTVEDCLGVCDGDAEYDCLGICDGTTQVDNCGVCGGDNTTCVFGCTDETALNYNSDAEVDDGSCEYPNCSSTTTIQGVDSIGFNFICEDSVEIGHPKCCGSHTNDICEDNRFGHEQNQFWVISSNIATAPEAWSDNSNDLTPKLNQWCQNQGYEQYITHTEETFTHNELWSFSIENGGYVHYMKDSSQGCSQESTRLITHPFGNENFDAVKWDTTSSVISTSNDCDNLSYSEGNNTKELVTSITCGSDCE